jgi:Uma2 family endonuclease
MRVSGRQEACVSTASIVPQSMVTAEEFSLRPDTGCPEELVRGRIVPMTVPKPRHGEICYEAGRILGNHARESGLGRVLSNNSGVITERAPDTVRGADVSYYSYARVPKGPLPDRYLDVPPDLVVEVLSPSDRWPKVLAKVGEYLDAGVTVVIVLEDAARSAHVYRADSSPEKLGPDDELQVPDVLPGFSVAVRQFFE